MPGAEHPGEEWEQLDSALAFDHRHFRVRRDTVRLPSGRVVDDYLVAAMPDYALVVAVTADREVVLARQWKQGVRRVTLELPGGQIDPNETPRDAAARELREETGYVAPTLELLAAFDVDASKAANRGHVFLALDARPSHAPEPDEMEQPVIVTVPVGDVPSLVESGEVTGAASVGGLLLALRRVAPD